MSSNQPRSAPPALDACAIATALAPQRFSITSATEIASVLSASQSISGSALALQRLALNRALPWRSA